MSTRRLTLAIAAVLLLAAACGEDDPTGPQAGSSYTLVAVDGLAVPAAYDSVYPAGRPPRYLRITGRSLDFRSADSVDYAQATDVVERSAAESGYTAWSVSCQRMRVTWRREGSRILLMIPPTLAQPAGATDTLQLVGRTLVQWRREPPTATYPTGRSWRLDYLPGLPLTAVCQPQR